MILSHKVIRDRVGWGNSVAGTDSRGGWGDIVGFKGKWVRRAPPHTSSLARIFQYSDPF